VITLAAALVVTFTPNPSHFGELVTAHVQGTGTPSFKPFVVRSQHGNSYVLQCLDPACVPGPGPLRLTVAGARLVILPRATAVQVAHPLRSFRRQTQPPPFSYNVRPSVLGPILLGAATLLLALAVVLLWPLLRRLIPEPHDDRTPLQRALDLVRGSLTRPPADRRRALDLLARALDRDGGSTEAEALELAWSRPNPEPRRVEELVERVEHET
jgi:hypothetical protein